MKFIEPPIRHKFYIKISLILLGKNINKHYLIRIKLIFKNPSFQRMFGDSIWTTLVKEENELEKIEVLEEMSKKIKPELPAVMRGVEIKSFEVVERIVTEEVEKKIKENIKMK